MEIQFRNQAVTKIQEIKASYKNIADEYLKGYFLIFFCLLVFLYIKNISILKNTTLRVEFFLEIRFNKLTI